MFIHKITHVWVTFSIRESAFGLVISLDLLTVRSIGNGRPYRLTSFSRQPQGAIQSSSHHPFSDYNHSPAVSITLGHFKCQVCGWVNWSRWKVVKAGEKKCKERNGGEKGEIEMYSSPRQHHAEISIWEGQTEGKAVSSLLISTDKLTPLHPLWLPCYLLLLLQGSITADRWLQWRANYCLPNDLKAK